MKRTLGTLSALLVAVPVLSLGALVTAPPAAALCIGPSSTICLPDPTVSETASTADKINLPGLAVGLAGTVLPQDAAQGETLQSLDQYAQGNSTANWISQGVKVLNWVPGFKLGFKGGGYLVDALGLVDNSSTPDPQYTPYANENVSSSPANWVGGQSVNYVSSGGQVFVPGDGYENGTANITVTYGTSPAGFTTTSTWTPTLSVTGTVTGQFVNKNGTLLGALNGYLWCSSLPISTGGNNTTSSTNFSMFLVANGQGGVTIQAVSGFASGNKTPTQVQPTTQSCAQGTLPVGLSIGTGVGSLTATPADATGFPWSTGPTSGAYNHTVYAMAKDLPNSPQGSTAQPSRQFRTRVTCLMASTGATSTVDTFSTPFKETDQSYTVPPQPGTCPTGSRVVATSLDLVDSTTLNVVKNLASQTLGTTSQNAITSQPSCVTNAGCGVTLWQKQGSTWVDCFTIGNACDGWATDANRSTDYSCTYGPGTSHDTDTAEPMSECYQYGPTFSPSKREQGIKYGDPRTDPATGTQGVNKPLPVVSQPPKVDPVTGTVTNPVTIPGSEGVSCWPSGFATIFEPLSWVLQPVKCALAWAFIPDQSTLSSLESTATNAFNNVGLTPWWNSASSFYGSLGGSGSGCQGPEIKWSLANLDFYPFDACSEPMATVATIFRDVVILFAIMAGLRSGMGALSGAFGFDFKMGHNGGGTDS